MSRFVMVLLLSKLYCDVNPTDFLDAQILMRTVLTWFMAYVWSGIKL